jgi:hypothetical protein
MALVLALAACAQGEIQRVVAREPHPSAGNATRFARSEREAAMNREWQNRPLAELLHAYGQPQMVMNIPGGGMPPGFALVYGRDPASGCIDAFAVGSGSELVIRVYHCR